MLLYSLIGQVDKTLVVSGHGARGHHIDHLLAHHLHDHDERQHIHHNRLRESQRTSEVANHRRRRARDRRTEWASRERSGNVERWRTHLYRMC